MEVVTMKKFLVLAVALLVSSAAWAANKTTPYVARAIFAGEASFSFTLKYVDTTKTGTPTMIEWTSADAFNMGSTTTWVRADQYAEVTANITKANANVYMYTDNKTDISESLEPNYWKYNGTTPDPTSATYGGLVRTAGQGTANGGAYRGYIPVYFSYTNALNSNITFNGTQRFGEDNVNIYDRPLADKSNAGFVLADNTIASLNGPTFGVDATTGAYPGSGLTNNTAYMYFFGGFKQVIGGDEYNTTIYVQEVLE